MGRGGTFWDMRRLHSASSGLRSRSSITIDSIVLLQGLDNVRPSFDLLSVRPSGAARVAAAAAASLDSNRSALTYLLAQTTIYDGDRIDHGQLARERDYRDGLDLCERPFTETLT